MRTLSVLALAVLALGAWGLLHAQKPFREYEGNEYNDFPLPSDWKQPAEFTRARLKYDDAFGGGRRFRRFGRGGGSWTTDYPRSDRHLLMGVRRLTRIDSRSVEQVTEPEGTDDLYNWPFVYAVEVGHWTLSDEQAAQMRDYFARGGFLMVDDFHGDYEWSVFEEGIRKVFPNRDIVELSSDEPIFHTIYDLNQRPQVPGLAALYNGVTYERGEDGGKTPHWRGIFDDKGRVVVAICHNMDLGDAWEHSDDPEYPENLASLAYRIAMNYFLYDFTH